MEDVVLGRLTSPGTLAVSCNGLVQGTHRDHPWDLCLSTQQSSHFVQFVRGTGGVRLWDDCPARGVRKMLFLLVFVHSLKLHETVIGVGNGMQWVRR